MQVFHLCTKIEDELGSFCSSSENDNWQNSFCINQEVGFTAAEKKEFETEHIENLIGKHSAQKYGEQVSDVFLPANLKPYI